MEKRKIKSEINSEFDIEYFLDINEDVLIYIINGKHEVESTFSYIYDRDRLLFKNISSKEDIDKCLLPLIDEYLSYWKNKKEFIELMKKKMIK